MASVTIKNYLMRDTVDSTALAVFNANPGGWASSAQVPAYLYTSLCTLWTGASGNIAAFNKALVVNNGQGLKPSKNCIIIDSIGCESADASGAEDSSTTSPNPSDRDGWTKSSAWASRE